MALSQCYCGRCSLNIEDAEYVVHGRPLCDPDCISHARRQKRASRDVPVGTSWAFLGHRDMAQIMALEG